MKGEQQEKDEKKKPPRNNFKKKLMCLLHVIFPSLLSKSGLFIVVYTIVLCSRVWITIKLASLVGELGSLMGKRDFPKMFIQQAWFSLWCYPAALANSMMKFLEKKIALQFRTELTKFIHFNYIDGRVFYKILLDKKLENLDQRTTADVELFCSTLTFIYGHLLKPFLDLLFLSHSLAKMMGFRQLFSFYAFFFISSAVLSVIKPNYSRLVSEQQRLEGFLRSDHARILQFSEEIAFVGGSDVERANCEKSYKILETQIDRSLWTHFWMDIIDGYVMKYGGSMMAYCAVIPSVFVNWKQMNSQQSVQHYLTVTTMLLGLGNALKDIMLSYKEVGKLEGLTNRVYELYNEIMEKRKEIKEEAKVRGEVPKNEVPVPGVVIRSPDIASIELINCDIYTPDGLTKLVDNISIKIDRGEHLILHGVNGTGKSSLFRTLGELWPLRAGTMKLPPRKEIYFISQNAYMCPGSFRDLLTYPEVHKSSPQLEERLLSLLERVELTGLLEKFGWNSVENWQSLLSGGEKQRLVIARLYFHQPEFGILDECTSAISIEMEHKIFEQAKDLGITLITIAHNRALRKHHKYQLNFLGGGAWSLTTISQEDNDDSE
uniref:ABC transporter domain-containing protein n=1 Tax=Arcella intermedia TaxID=1963864 RepID=A0A6B2L0G9_9EUKA